MVVHGSGAKVHVVCRDAGVGGWRAPAAAGPQADAAADQGHLLLNYRMPNPHEMTRVELQDARAAKMSS